MKKVLFRIQLTFRSGIVCALHGQESSKICAIFQGFPLPQPFSKRSDRSVLDRLSELIPWRSNPLAQVRRHLAVRCSVYHFPPWVAWMEGNSQTTILHVSFGGSLDSSYGCGLWNDRRWALELGSKNYVTSSASAVLQTRTVHFGIQKVACQNLK